MLHSLNAQPHEPALGVSKDGTRRSYSHGRRSSGGSTSTHRSRILAFERHYTPDELAAMWHVAANTVRSWCEDYGGVLVINRPERRFKRGYKSIRVPESVAAEIYTLHFEAVA